MPIQYLNASDTECTALPATLFDSVKTVSKSLGSARCNCEKVNKFTPQERCRCNLASHRSWKSPEKIETPKSKLDWSKLEYSRIFQFTVWLSSIVQPLLSTRDVNHERRFLCGFSIFLINYLHLMSLFRRFLQQSKVAGPSSMRTIMLMQWSAITFARIVQSASTTRLKSDIMRNPLQYQRQTLKKMRCWENNWLQTLSMLPAAWVFPPFLQTVSVQHLLLRTHLGISESRCCHWQTTRTEQNSSRPEEQR